MVDVYYQSVNLSINTILQSVYCLPEQLNFLTHIYIHSIKSANSTFPHYWPGDDDNNNDDDDDDVS